MLAMMTAESSRNAKKFEVLDLRLNSTKGPSIHDENQRDVPNVREKLPEELTLTDLPKFTGAEDPLIHVKAFKGKMAVKRVGKDYWHLVFPHSLGPNPQSWFYSLDNKKVDTWEEIAVAFTEQYKDNVETRVSMRTLEVLTQNEKEGFTDFLARWRAVSTQLTNRPSESEMVAKFINNLRQPYHGHMRYSNIENFRQLTAVGTKIEDDLRASATAKRGYQGTTSRASSSDVNTLDLLSNTREKK